MTLYNLPLQATPFVGRVQEIEAVMTLLDTPDCQLLTLVGPGGSGKTRLALEVANRMRKAFADHVFFVALQPLSDARNVPYAISEALNLQLNASMDLEDQLLAYLAVRQQLLVLDNCEHVLEKADFFAEIVQYAPMCKILATSRESLKLQQEWIVQVGGMAYPEAVTSDMIGHYDAVQLFVNRARQVQSDFNFDHQQSSVLRICQLVEGMPLALELAASWMRTLTCEEIANEVSHSLAILTSNLRNVSERHRSIQAVFDHSWRLLSQAEQHMLPRLSVFQGGFEREAAKEIADATLMTLSSLVDKSLVRKDAFSGRYALHELVKQYAAEKLVDSGEAESTSDRHAAYYTEFLLAREDDLKGHRQLAAHDEIAANFENIRVAWEWALNRNHFDLVGGMLESLNLVGFDRDRYHIEQLIKQARYKLTPESDVLLYGRVLVRSDRDRTPEVRAKLDTALKIVEKHGEQLEIGLCLFQKGWIALHLDANLPDASHLLEQALAHFDGLNHRFYMARTNVELSLAYDHQGYRAKAEESAKVAFDLVREMGDRFNLLWALVVQDLQAQLRGDFQISAYVQQEIIVLSRQLNIPYATRCAHLLQTLYGDFAGGNFERARIQINRILTEMDEAQDTRKNYASVYLVQGMLANVEGDYRAARVLCEKGELNPLFLYAEMVCGLSTAAYGLGEYDKIVQIILPALKKAHAINGLGWMAWCLPPLILLLAYEGQLLLAVELLGLAFTHPASVSGWLEKWPLMTQLRADLKTGLGAVVYASAWDRGTNRDLKATAADLIHRYETRQQDSHSMIAVLSEREVQILHLVADGLSNRAIAEELTLAVGTVKWYLHEIRSKLGVNNRIQAVIRARELHIL